MYYSIVPPFVVVNMPPFEASEDLRPGQLVRVPLGVNPRHVALPVRADLSHLWDAVALAAACHAVPVDWLSRGR